MSGQDPFSWLIAYKKAVARNYFWQRVITIITPLAVATSLIVLFRSSKIARWNFDIFWHSLADGTLLRYPTKILFQDTTRIADADKPLVTLFSFMLVIALVVTLSWIIIHIARFIGNLTLRQYRKGTTATLWSREYKLLRGLFPTPRSLSTGANLDGVKAAVVRRNLILQLEAKDFPVIFIEPRHNTVLQREGRAIEQSLMRSAKLLVFDQATHDALRIRTVQGFQRKTARFLTAERRAFLLQQLRHVEIISNGWHVIAIIDSRYIKDRNQLNALVHQFRSFVAGYHRPDATMMEYLPSADGEAAPYLAMRLGRRTIRIPHFVAGTLLLNGLFFLLLAIISTTQPLTASELYLAAIVTGSSLTWAVSRQSRKDIL